MNKVYLHKIENNRCGHFLIKKTYAPYAKRFSNLNYGTCESVGYNIRDGEIEIKAPIIGKIVIDKFKIG